MSIKLRSKQLKAARLVAWGWTGAEVSKLLGLCPHTLSRWKKIPEFNLECEKVIREQHEEMRYRMANLAAASVDIVWAELQDETADSRRVSVALSLLKLLKIEQSSAPKALKISENAPKPATIEGIVHD